MKNDVKDNIGQSRVFMFDRDELGMLRTEMGQLHEDNKEMKTQIVGVGVLVTLDIVLNIVRIVLALC